MPFESRVEAAIGIVAELDPQARNLIEAASVLGTSFDLPTLAALTDDDEVDVARATQRAVAPGLLREAGTRLAFASESARREIYNAVPAAVRPALHRRAATLLADQPERAAPHLAAGGERDAAVAAWRAAAHQARARFAESGTGVVNLGSGAGSRRPGRR